MKASAYKTIQKSLLGLLEGPITWESALVSLIALIKEHRPETSWVGLYRNIEGHLWVGPYQGKLACIHLGPGQGVCGKALAAQNTLVVPDVHAFEGHVFCDPLARSEIVTPVYRVTEDGRRILVGVLDLDSHLPDCFDAMDQEELERLVSSIERLPSPQIR